MIQKMYLDLNFYFDILNFFWNIFTQNVKQRNDIIIFSDTKSVLEALINEELKEQNNKETFKDH